MRDSTLGRESVDIDIVVEGDGIKVARQLNAKLKGKLTSHAEFGTATISINSHRVDLASARTEKYSSPAHLPHVYPSTIVEDLNRRDFTINAIAMSISRENYGEIFDPFEGMSDIKKKLIRILHRNSFIDDPTRIFRALRYKNRFGFKVEEDTEHLMSEAIKSGMVSKLSGQRILNELELIFEEETFQHTVEDLAYYGVFPIKRSELKKIPSSNSHAFYFFLSRLSKNTLPLTKEAQEIVADFRDITDIVAQLQKTNKKSKIYSVLSPLTPTVIEAIAYMRSDLKEKVAMFRSLQKIKPFIKAKDLQKYGIRPAKHYARILGRIFALQLDRKLQSRKQALEYLKTLKKK